MPKFTAVVLLLAIAWTVSAAHDWDGSPVLPVHRIPLHDEDGVKILSDAENAKPISARATCIQCHDYDAIQTGWHFSSEGDLEGRATEPWVMVDEKSGTQLPISRRGAAGTWAPEHLGMSDWDFIKQFARHMPGGGPGEGERAAADPDSRWTVSGDLEINCFVCHNTGPHQDMTEWVKQIARENFRWAATAAACLGEVSGMAARLPATWNPSDGPDPDDLIYRVPPSVTYPETLFDSKDRVVLDLGKPTDARCIQCHAVAEVGKAKHHVTGDIHTRAGMDCISCHSNGIDHKIDRGSTGAFSCAGCHGLEDSEADIGSYGAPIPEHKGLPPIHLEKMACTACHSGVAIDHGPSLVRTSKINRLGIHGRAQWMIEAPQILEPIFKRDGSGKIAPHRMMWPAFWARSSGDDLKPLDAQDVMAQSSDILDPAMVVASVLSRLGKIKDQDGYAYGQPVFVSDGIVYQSTADGGLDQHPYNGEIPGAFRFGYIVDNALLPIAEPYDAEEENGFYYLDESRQEHVISVLTALAEIAPDGTTPAWILGSKLHRLQNVEYALLPAEEFAQLKQDAEKAKVAVTTLATKLDVATEVDGTKQKFYRKSDKTELKASRSKTPELYKLKVLMKEQRKAEAKLSELEVIGDKAYRNTFQKNTSQYPVIEEFKGTSNTAWGWVKDDQAQPLVPDYVGAFVTATGGGDTVAFTEKQIAMALEKLGEDVVYVSGGKVFSRNADGSLKASEHQRAEPVSWPLGHDVRPAAQSLGAKGCAECHSADAPFLFANVAAQGPLQSDQTATATMAAHMQLDSSYHQLFGLSFTTRPLFKAIMLALAIIALLVLAAYALSGIRGLSQRAEKPKLAAAAMTVGAISTVILALTGFGGDWTGGLGGYMLLVHVGVGGLFAACLALVALLKAHDHGAGGSCYARNASFWTMIVCGIVLILSILVSMVPLLGTAGQHSALQVHEIAAAVFLVAAAVYAISRRSCKSGA